MTKEGLQPLVPTKAHNSQVFSIPRREVQRPRVRHEWIKNLSMLIGTSHTEEDPVDWARELWLEFGTVEAVLVFWIPEECLQGILLFH